MKFEKYNGLKAFGSNTLEILLENEMQNNLPIGFITGSGDKDTSNCFLAIIKDDSGGVLLTTACTPSGAVVNGVYTPPHYHGRGYASSLVAGISKILLERSNKFCCLFADVENPISCGIYRKLGYYDLCVFDELKFKEDAK